MHSHYNHYRLINAACLMLTVRIHYDMHGNKQEMLHASWTPYHVIERISADNRIRFDRTRISDMLKFITINLLNAITLIEVEHSTPRPLNAKVVLRCRIFHLPLSSSSMVKKIAGEAKILRCRRRGFPREHRDGPGRAHWDS